MNYTRFLTRDYESQKILERYYADPKRTQMPAQAKLSITIDGEIKVFHEKKQKQIHTISFQESSPSKDNKRKEAIQGRNSRPRTSKKAILQQN